MTTSRNITPIPYFGGTVIIEDIFKKFEIVIEKDENNWSYSSRQGAGIFYSATRPEAEAMLWLGLEHFLCSEGLDPGIASTCATALVMAIPVWDRDSDTAPSKGELSYTQYADMADAMKSGKPLSPTQVSELWTAFEATRHELESCTTGGSEYFCSPHRRGKDIRNQLARIKYDRHRSQPG